MKSFKEILREQEGGRKEFRDLLKSGQIDIKIEQQPADPTKPKTSRRKRNVGQGKPAQTTTQQPASAKPELTKQQQSAINKGYRTPEGNISQRGVETYATRRGAMGYGDPGKDPSKYGVDPRRISADARQRTTSAAAGDKAARSSIKADVKKIEARYPAPKPATGSQSSFSQFSRRASSITSDIKTGRANIPTPEMSAKDTKFFRGLEPDPVKRTAAKIDAAIGQQADDLMGKKGPQAPTRYSNKGLADLSKAIDAVDDVKPATPPKPTASSVAPRRGQGSRVVGSRVARGGAPQAGTRQTAAMLDALRDMGTTQPLKPKPQQPSTVTYGGGRGRAAAATPKPQTVTPTTVSKPQTPVQPQAPKPQFKTTQVKLPEPPKSSSPSVAPPAAKPRVTLNNTPAPAAPTGREAAKAKVLNQIDTNRRLATNMGRARRLGTGTMGVLSKVGGPATAAIEGGIEMADPEKKPSLVRTGVKKGAQLAAASKGAQLGAKIGGLGGPWGRVAGTVIGGGIGYATAGGAFEKVAGQTPTEKALAAKTNRQVQQIQKPQYGDTPKGDFDTRPLQTVIKDPRTGKETVGYLAKRTYKGQEYTGYKAADTSNAARAASSSNPFERIGRTLFPSAYTKSDEEAMKKRVAKIKQLQGLPESRKPAKTYTQFMEQVRDTYQQSDTSKKTQSGTERVLRGIDTVAHLVSKGMGRTTDFLGSATSGAVKGLTGRLVDLEKIGYEGEKLINRAGRGLRDTEKRMGRNLSQTNIQLNPPGSGYPSNLRRGR